MSASFHEKDKQTTGIDGVKKHIHQNTNQVLDREELANMAGSSLPHFHRIFTAEVGENIAAYIRRVRLERAAQKLIHGATDLMQVAMDAGFQSHAAFSKAFKQHFGYTPSEFRKLNFMVALEVVRKSKMKGIANDKDKTD